MFDDNNMFDLGDGYLSYFIISTVISNSLFGMINIMTSFTPGHKDDGN